MALLFSRYQVAIALLLLNSLNLHGFSFELLLVAHSFIVLRYQLINFMLGTDISLASIIFCIVLSHRPVAHRNWRRRLSFAFYY